MAPKKTVNVLAAAPTKSGRQRTMTNKQQQLRKNLVSSSLDVNLIFFTLLVAQKNEKEEAATQQALTDAIWSEQRQEELNGFHKRNLKVPGNPTLSSLFLIELERTPAR